MVGSNPLYPLSVWNESIHYNRILSILKTALGIFKEHLNQSKYLFGTTPEVTSSVKHLRREPYCLAVKVSSSVSTEIHFHKANGKGNANCYYYCTGRSNLVNLFFLFINRLLLQICHTLRLHIYIYIYIHTYIYVYIYIYIHTRKSVGIVISIWRTHLS